VWPLTIARHWPGKHIPMATNTCNNRRIVDRIFFYMASIISKESVCMHMYPPIITRQWLSKYVPVSPNTRSSRGIVGCPFLCGPCHMKGKEAIIPRTPCTDFFVASMFRTCGRIFYTYVDTSQYSDIHIL
jgi:hypothetical protein